MFLFFGMYLYASDHGMAILSPLHEEFSLDAQPPLIVSKTHAKASSKACLIASLPTWPT